MEKEEGEGEGEVEKTGAKLFEFLKEERIPSEKNGVKRTEYNKALEYVLKELEGRRVKKNSKVVEDHVYVAIVGSTSFFDESGRSEEISWKLGEALGNHYVNPGLDVILLTGGLTGPPEVMGRGFYSAKQNVNNNTKDKSMTTTTTTTTAIDNTVFHLLPNGLAKRQPWDYGVTLGSGVDMEERRKILVQLANVVILIEGGPGTVDEGMRALERGSEGAEGVVVIPIVSTGGAASGQFGMDIVKCRKNLGVSCEEDWKALSDSKLSADNVVKVVLGIIDKRIK